MDEQIYIKEEECNIDDIKLEPVDFEDETTVNENINYEIYIHEIKLETNGVYEESPFKNNQRYVDSSMLLLQTNKPNINKLLTNFDGQCNICQAKFSTIHQLHIHKKIHRDPKRFICNVCYKNFSKLSLLNDHKETHEGNDQCEPKESKEGMCHVCGKMSNRLKLHVKWHDKSIECTQCDYRCAHRAHLAQHMRVHTGAKHYGCDLCGKHFQRKHDLSRHKSAVHSKIRPFKCSVCLRAFAKNKSLISHKCL